MQNYTDTLLESLIIQEELLDKMSNQRIMWLYASSVVFLSIVFVIAAWDWLDSFQSKYIWWVIVSCMLVISVNWWYWTMRVIRHVIACQKIEYKLVREILAEISYIRSHIEKV